LGMLIRMECGLDIPDKILKYDGRPFFYDELLSSVMERCASTPEKGANLPGFEYAGASS
jgi:2-oxoglutarate/2-oxoacid ferredoxin oxidoreductase subunit alpha